MMNLCIVTSVENSEILRYLVKGLRMLQGWRNVPSATHDGASVDVADGISKSNHFWRNKSAGEILHSIFDGRPSLSASFSSEILHSIFALSLQNSHQPIGK